MMRAPNPASAPRAVHIGPRAPVRGQRGAALIVGLVLLVVLTLLGVVAMTNNVLEQRMAVNMEDINLAFNAAETAARAMQTQIAPLLIEPQAVSDCASAAPPCVLSQLALGRDWWQGADKDHNWWLANGNAYGGSGDEEEIAGVATQPRYIAEEEAFVPDSARLGHGTQTGTNYYRITARGTGASDASQAVVQQSISKRFN